jgi:hypothetical protein
MAFFAFNGNKDIPEPVPRAMAPFIDVLSVPYFIRPAAADARQKMVDDLAGWHWCSYLENDASGWGLKDPGDEPYRELTDAVTVPSRTAVASRGMVPA